MPWTKTNVRFIPNGVDLAVFQPGPAIRDDGPLHVLCVARLIERKGQDHLIEAIKQLTDSGIDVVLSLIGTGDSQTDYEDQARRLGIEIVYGLSAMYHETRSTLTTAQPMFLRCRRTMRE